MTTKNTRPTSMLHKIGVSLERIKQLEANLKTLENTYCNLSDKVIDIDNLLTTLSAGIIDIKDSVGASIKNNDSNITITKTNEFNDIKQSVTVETYIGSYDNIPGILNAIDINLKQTKQGV